MPTNASRSNFELEKYFFDLGTNVGKVDRHLTRRSPSLRLPPPATRGPRQGCIASEHLQERERREGTVRPDKLSTIRCQIFSFKKKKKSQLPIVIIIHAMHSQHPIHHYRRHLSCPLDSKRSVSIRWIMLGC